MNGTRIEGRPRTERVSGFSAGGDWGGPDRSLERRLSPPSARVALGLGLCGIGLGLAALLGASPRRRKAAARLTGAAAGVVGVTVLERYAAAKRRGRAETVDAGPVRGAITIAVTPDRAYQYWRELRNLPSFLEWIASVEELDGQRSRWRMHGPFGRVVQWDAEIIEDRPRDRIRWRSVPGGEVSHVGEVRFREAPGDRGVEVTVELSYLPPAGVLGKAASFLADQTMNVRLERDLRRLKQLLELGQIVHSDASICRGRHAAQPSKEPATT